MSADGIALWGAYNSLGHLCVALCYILRSRIWWRTFKAVEHTDEVVRDA
jgi:hypothetical protein